MNFERWQNLMQKLGIGEHREMFARLCDSYGERHRHYHTGKHISACLEELEHWGTVAEFPAEVEAALWFHDIFYAPMSTENEKRSADIAVQFLMAAGADPAACGRIHSHIMATRHSAEPETSDAALVVDIDLTILGQAPEAFAEFEKQIRAEYKWAPELLYRRKRAEILASFLERERIYLTSGLHERYEKQARSNLEQAIAKLA